MTNGKKNLTVYIDETAQKALVLIAARKSIETGKQVSLSAMAGEWINEKIEAIQKEGK